MPPLALVEGEDKSQARENAASIAGEWLDRFGQALASGGEPGFEDLFVEDGWLKDELVFSWDMRTLHGITKISQYVSQSLPKSGFLDCQISTKPGFTPTLKETGPMSWIEAGFDFRSKVGKGRGILRLTNTAIGRWKAWIAFFGLEELDGHARRSNDRSHVHQRQEAAPGKRDVVTEPAVVIIGAASTGLAVAACLQDVGIQALLVERDQRVGDVWRKRYKRLQLHSPSYGDARPFVSVPRDWPMFPSKDQYADYLESYAQSLNLDIWLGTELKAASYDDDACAWIVETAAVDGDARRTLHPRHVVWAGSAFLDSHPIVPTLPGRDGFKGTFYHAGEHQSAADVPDVRGKKVVVIGSKTTAHDLCQDYAEAGADVTMIQRSPTLVHSPEACVQIMMPPPPKDQSHEDFLLGMRSFPSLVAFGFMSQLTQHMLQFDSKLIGALDQTEFVASKGEDGDSLLRRGFTTRGGFYVNHGASDLIASGKIAVMYCPAGVQRLTTNGLVLADGRAAEADIIVAATAWQQIEDVLADVVGEAVASRVDRFVSRSLIDDEGEMRGIFRPTGHPGFWIAAGNLIGSSISAPGLALQILALETGHNKGH